MAYLSLNISIITLTVNSLNALIRRQRMPEWIKNYDSIMLSIRTSLQTKQHRLKKKTEERNIM